MCAMCKAVRLRVVYIPRSLFALSHLHMHIHTELDTLEWRQPMSSLGILDHFPSVHRFQNLLCGIMAITPWCRVLGSRKGWAREGPLSGMYGEYSTLGNK